MSLKTIIHIVEFKKLFLYLVITTEFYTYLLFLYFLGLLLKEIFEKLVS